MVSMIDMVDEAGFPQDFEMVSACRLSYGKSKRSETVRLIMTILAQFTDYLAPLWISQRSKHASELDVIAGRFIAHEESLRQVLVDCPLCQVMPARPTGIAAKR